MDKIEFKVGELANDKILRRIVLIIEKLDCYYTILSFNFGKNSFGKIETYSYIEHVVRWDRLEKLV